MQSPNSSTNNRSADSRAAANNAATSSTSSTATNSNSNNSSSRAQMFRQHLFSSSSIRSGPGSSTENATRSGRSRFDFPPHLYYIEFFYYIEYLLLGAR